MTDANLSDVKRELLNHIQLTRQEKRCLSFEVSQDNKNMNRFNVYEEFISQNAFEFHQQRIVGTEWSKISSKLEKHYKTSSIV